MICPACGHHRAYHTHSGCIDCECTWAGNTREPETVKRASLWDGVIDTYQTESEMNGWKPTQGVLL